MAMREISPAPRSERMRRATSWPSIPGRPMSTRATTGRMEKGIYTPSGPLPATDTRCPQISSSSRSDSRPSSLSSTTRTWSPAAGFTREKVPAGGVRREEGFRRSSESRGKRTMNSLPCPGPSLRASTPPPCISTRLRTSGSPSPRPPSERWRELSTWANGSKIVCSIPGERPTPVSRTRKTASISSMSTETQRRPPRGVYLMAFWSRLQTTCSSRTGSPITRAVRVSTARSRSLPRASDLMPSSTRQRSTTSRRSTGRRCRLILPRVTRETSSRSSTMRTRWRVWRMMISRWRTSRSSCEPTSSSTQRALRMAAMGLRSSWPSMARNSSLRRSASAWRASRPRTSYWRRRVRSAALTALTRVLRRAGRSRMGALPSGTRASSTRSLLSPLRVNTISGRSDQGGCSSSTASRPSITSGWSASSARMTAPAPAAISRNSSSALAQAWPGTSIVARSWQASTPSRPVGARTSTRCSWGSSSLNFGLLGRAAVAQERLGGPRVLETSAEHPLEFLDLSSDPDPAGADAQLAHRVLVGAGAPLDQRDRLADLTERLEVAQQDHRIGQVGEVDRRLQGLPHETRLGHHQQGQHPLLVEVGEQLVQMEQEEALLRHGVPVAVQAVEHHDADAVLDRAADVEGELARRQLGGIDLADRDAPLLDLTAQGEAEPLGPADPVVRELVERIDGGVVAALRGRRDVLRRQGRLADAGRPEEHGAGPPVEAAAEHGVQLRKAARDRPGLELVGVRCRHQPREDRQAAGGDPVVVVAVAEGDAAHLLHPQPPPLAAVPRGEILEGDHAVGEALELEVARGVARVIEQQHRAILAVEVVLQRQDLPPVAQRVAGQQPHLGERVEDDSPRLHPLDRVQHRLRGLRKLHLGRVEQGVLGVGLEALLGGLQLADGDAVERPAVGGGHVAELLFSLREGGVDARLAVAGSGEQELQRRGGLAGARIALEQVHPVDGKAAAEDVVQPFDPRGGPDEALEIFVAHVGSEESRPWPALFRAPFCKSDAEDSGRE